MSTLLDESYVLVIACVRHDHAARERQDADPVITLEAVVMAQLIGQGGRNILRWLVQALVAFLRMTSEACCSVLLDFGPQGFVGGTHLTRDRTSHLSSYLVASAYLCIGAFLQAHFIAHLAMLKSIPADVVQRITIGQLCGSQCLKLLWRRVQFEFGGECYFHERTIAWFHQIVNKNVLMSISLLRPCHYARSSAIAARLSVGSTLAVARLRAKNALHPFHRATLGVLTTLVSTSILTIKVSVSLTPSLFFDTLLSVFYTLLRGET